MPVKRSRAVKSSSSGEIRVLNLVSQSIESPDTHWERRTAPAVHAVKPPSNSAKMLKSSVDEMDRSPPKILTLSSPVQESVDLTTEGQMGGFLEKCCYCKKKIREDKEVFMYGYLRAFCTSECRDKQIAIDKEVEGDPEESTDALNEHQMPTKLKRHSGSGQA